jgi:hypothetical protein
MKPASETLCPICHRAKLVVAVASIPDVQDFKIRKKEKKNE